MVHTRCAHACVCSTLTPTLTLTTTTNPHPHLIQAMDSLSSYDALGGSAFSPSLSFKPPGLTPGSAHGSSRPMGSSATNFGSMGANDDLSSTLTFLGGDETDGVDGGAHGTCALALAPTPSHMRCAMDLHPYSSPSPSAARPFLTSIPRFPSPPQTRSSRWATFCPTSAS